VKHNQKFLDLVEVVRSHIKEVDVETVKKQMDANAELLLIDVREESEWYQDHLPNAVHLSRGVIELRIENAVPDPATPLVLYCGGGYRSALAADNLQKMGYTNVASMAGGYRAWQSAGYSLVSEHH
jgi:rhodanese-related sulfurtransferase